NRIDTDGCNNACQSSTTTVVTTTTVIEQVNDDGGTTRTPTTTTQVVSTPPAVVPEDTPPTTPVLCSDDVTTVDDGCTCDFPVLMSKLWMAWIVTGDSVNERLPLGATVTFVCADGFELDDNQTMTCTGSGIWSPGYPSCTLSAEGECVEEGGTWQIHDGGSCEADGEQGDGSATGYNEESLDAKQAEGECENEGGTWEAGEQSCSGWPWAIVRAMGDEQKCDAGIGDWRWRPREPGKMERGDREGYDSATRTTTYWFCTVGE
ncbi:MAG: hypothetical protein ABGY10_05555, partial [bacterium]